MVLPSLLFVLYPSIPIIYLTPYNLRLYLFVQMYYFPKYISIQFVLALLLLSFVLSAHSISFFYILYFFSLQPCSILDPKVLGLQSGG